MTTNNEIRKQVVAQCRVAAQLARTIANLEEDYANMIEAGGLTELLETQGLSSHQIMEDFGNLLNNWDAASEEDTWMTPIYERARQMFPLKDLGVE